MNQSLLTTKLETERLILRLFEEKDLPAFAEMSGDEESMKYLGGAWDKNTSQGFIERTLLHHQEHSFGIYAIELKESKEFIGFCGLKTVTFQEFFTPATEIGWRFNRKHWNKGYATECAKKILEHAFANLKLKEVISYVTPHNIASVKIMEKLGMQKSGHFKHPQINETDVFSNMVLYKVQNRFRLSPE